MTTIYLIRHAEAEGNLYRRAQGQYDSNITPLGRKQIAALAERFRAESIDALYSSDLTRTQTTATAITKYHPHLRPVLMPQLREQAIGLWEDWAWGDLSREFNRELATFSSRPDLWFCEGAESFDAMQARMLAALQKIGAENDGRTVAVTSHGMAIRSVLCAALGMPKEQVAAIPHGDNTGVSKLLWDKGVLRVEWYNDNSHLGADISTFARQTWWKHPDGSAEDHENASFLPLTFPADEELYTECYRQTWLASHGNTADFAPGVYLQSARARLADGPEFLVKLCYKGQTVGLIELNPHMDRAFGAGRISLIYMRPEYRGRRLGIQLYGHAVSVFRRYGLNKIRLHVSQTNEAAIGFYEHNDFRRLEAVKGVGGPLWLMEADITPRLWVLP